MNTPDGKTQYVHVWMEKTQKPINVPLSNEALRYMEKKEDPDAKLFKLPTSDATINYHIKKWMKAAKIDKKISYHCSSHSKFFYLLNISELSILKNVTANDLETSYILFLSQLCNIQRTL